MPRLILARRAPGRTPLVLAALLLLGSGWMLVVESGFVTADDPNQMLMASGHMSGGSPDPHLIYSNYLWGCCCRGCLNSGPA